MDIGHPGFAKLDPRESISRATQAVGSGKRQHSQGNETCQGSTRALADGCSSYIVLGT